MGIVTNETELRNALEKTGQRHGPGLFGMVVDDRRVVFTGAYGTADVAHPRSITAADRFRIGSVTKVYVATVLLQLAAEGVLALDDTVEYWLPGLVPGGDEITVEMLARMRSGIPDYVKTLLGDPIDPTVLDRYWPPADLVKTALRAGDRWEPDTGYRYSNTDYILLGLVIERATGQPLEAQLWQRIFDPLRLTQTTMPAVDPVLRGAHANGYVRLNAHSDYLDCTTTTPSESFSSGAIISTPGEVAAFLDALLTGQLPRAEQLAVMLDCREVIDARRSRGLGIVAYQFGEHATAYGHQGGVAGFSTVAMRTTTGRTVVLYQNALDLSAPLAYDAPFVLAAVDA